MLSYLLCKHSQANNSQEMLIYFVWNKKRINTTQMPPPRGNLHPETSILQTNEVKKEP